jgi:aryl-alcohol dehydrogenase-like predicted oxidoreductase
VEFLLKEMCMCMYVFVCRELGIAIVPYSPLGRGFFAGYTVEGNKEGDTRVVVISPSLLTSCFSTLKIVN